MAHIIIGTAGHIDHGKTSLVKVLTGVDTDRLKEEKERGLTIDIGFAHWGDRATIIDVPGHEKFIRNMVAGVSTIDLVLLVVAADDGVMPQTREHLDILKILQIAEGIIVITKIDLVEKDWVELVEDDVRSLVTGSFLEKAPILPVSSTTLDGIDELKKTLENHWQRSKQKEDKGIFWMPVDRSFSIKGFGTVVTGSVLSGTARVGQSIEALPQKNVLKIRGIQSHSRSVTQIGPGDRAAINLQSVSKDTLQRGDVLASPNYFQASDRVDARFQLLKSAPRPIKSGTRLRLHIGTAEIMTRVSLLGVAQLKPGETAYVQFHLESPAPARRLDPFLIRQYSPTITIGGGIILHANARRHRASDPKVVEQLKALEKENPKESLERQLLLAGFGLGTIDQLASELAASKEDIQKYLDELEGDGRVTLLKKEGRNAVVHRKNYQEFQDRTITALESFHKENPTKIGLRKTEFLKQIKPKPDMALLEWVLTELKSEKRVVETDGYIHVAGQQAKLSKEQAYLCKQIDQLLYDEAFTTSSEAEIAERLEVNIKTISELMNLMLGLHQVIFVEGRILFHAKRMDEAKQKLVSFLKTHGEITIGEFKDLIGGTSRKYALPLLIHFDGMGITQREGAVRILGDVS